MTVERIAVQIAEQIGANAQERHGQQRAEERRIVARPTRPTAVDTARITGAIWALVSTLAHRDIQPIAGPPVLTLGTAAHMDHMAITEAGLIVSGLSLKAGTMVDAN